LGLGRCSIAPMDVYLNDRNVIQPDILFIKTENLSIIKEGKIKGTPDLIVEVLSSNRRHDLTKKKALYETFGVKEYFIVDPDTKETITYYHDGKKYIQQEGKHGKLKSKLLKKVFNF
jgi:Uma2 family endonuclease